MPVGPEAKIQVAIVRWLRAVMPQAIIVHVPNEHGKRGKAGMLAAQRQKTMGALSGCPDLIVFPYASTGVFALEVKSAKGRVSSAQEQVHIMLRDRGYAVGVVRSIDDVRAFLQEHGIGFNEVAA